MELFEKLELFFESAIFLTGSGGSQISWISQNSKLYYKLTLLLAYVYVVLIVTVYAQYLVVTVALIYRE